MSGSAATPGVGRAVARYTAMRLLVFGVVFVLARLVIQDTLLALAVAVLGSAVLSIPLLRPYRHDLNVATAARAERRRSAAGPPPTPSQES